MVVSTCYYKWLKCFTHGWPSSDNDLQSGQPWMYNYAQVVQVHDIVHFNYLFDSWRNNIRM